MKTIIEQLESEIPHGLWCNQGAREEWCPYFKIINHRGFCNLSEEYVERKECEINEAEG